MSTFIKKSILLVVLSLLSTVALIAQSFSAYTTEKEVTVNQPFELTFSLKNARGGNFTPPDFGSAKVISGPSQSSSTTMINGQVSSEMSISYTLMPTEVGLFEIKPARIVSGAKTLRSNALKVKVVEAKKIDFAGVGELPEAFVRLEPSTRTAYTGQQILLDYKLYTSVDLQDINIVSESEYAGFFFEPLRRFSKTQTRQNIKGKDYVLQTVRRIALFPQQAGSFEIEASQVSAQIVVGRRRSGFFTYAETKPLYLTTEPLTIEVKPLPTGAPSDFTGAVGDDFSVNVTVPRNTLTTDDAIALRMDIRGNGDVKRVQPPALDLGKNFEVYEPKVLQEENYENRGELYGKKIVEYLVLPKKPGQYDLTAQFSYFHPDSAAYRTVSEKTPRLSIRQGSQKGQQDISINRSEGIDNNTLRPNKATAYFSEKGNPFFGSALFWGLFVLPILGFVAAIIYKKKQDAEKNIDAGELKMRHAVKVAKEKLSGSHKFMEQGDSRAFYDEVQRAFLGYVGDKFQIPPAQMSKAIVRQKLNELNVSESNINSFVKILETSEMALFAGMDNSSAMTDIYKSAEDVIVRIEEEVGAGS